MLKLQITESNFIKWYTESNSSGFENLAAYIYSEITEYGQAVLTTKLLFENTNYHEIPLKYLIGINPVRYGKSNEWLGDFCEEYGLEYDLELIADL